MSSLQATSIRTPQLQPQTLSHTESAEAAQAAGFASLGLLEPIQRALLAERYETPTPIQAQAIPALLAGRDLLACAQTGTGKTAAFALPILQRLAVDRRPPPPRGARALVLAPTRELAVQVADSFRTYGRYMGLGGAVVFGGVGQRPQVDSLARGVDVLVATPGRLLDLISQGHVRLGGIEILVLDEADRMLDMGFLPDVRRIIETLPERRQTLLFSATVSEEIRQLARRMLRDPMEISVAASATTVEGVGQWVLFVETADKRALLEEVLARDPSMKRTLVFNRTKHGTNRLAQQLARAGVQAEAIHGNKSQNARQAALERFRSGRVRVLVATDLAARGLDVDGITHVVNYDLPHEPECYVHRIGRTARAGARGVALSFCASEERANLRDIERLTRKQLTVVEDHPYRSNVLVSQGPSRDDAAPRLGFSRRAGGGRGWRRR